MRRLFNLYSAKSAEMSIEYAEIKCYNIRIMCGDYHGKIHLAKPSIP